MNADCDLLSQKGLSMALDDKFETYRRLIQLFSSKAFKHIVVETKLTVSLNGGVGTRRPQYASNGGELSDNDTSNEASIDHSIEDKVDEVVANCGEYTCAQISKALHEHSHLKILFSS